MSWIAVGAAILAAGSNYYNTERTAKRQDRALTQQIQQQSKRQQEADREVAQTLAERAASNADANKQTTLDQYLSQARAAQGAATSGLNQAGAVSSAYQQSANDAALGVGDYANSQASLMSRIDAPTQQRNQEAISNAQLNSRLGLIGNRAASDDYLANLKLQGIRRDSGLDLLSQVAGAYGAAMSGGAGGVSTADLSNQANTITAANNKSLFNSLQSKWGY